MDMARRDARRHARDGRGEPLIAVPKKDRSVLIALVLQVAALAALVLIYLYLRGLANEDRPTAVIPFSTDQAEDTPGGPR